MAEKEGKKKAGNLDDILNEMKEKHSKDLDASFKAHDDFTKDENINHLYNRILAPAQDNLYKTLSDELDKIFKDDDEKLKGKEKEVKKALASALKKYFETAQPSITKAIDTVGLSEEEQYDYLTSLYDDHVGAGKVKGVESISKLVEGLTKDKKATSGHIKRHVYEQKTKQIEGAINLMVNKYVSNHFGKYHPVEVAAYLKPQLEKAGYEIEDKLGYATADLGDLIGLRRALVRGEGHKYLKKKEEEKKDDKKKAA